MIKKIKIISLVVNFFCGRNNVSSDKCNIETLQDVINAAIVKYTPENDSPDMDNDETINGDIFRISG